MSRSCDYASREAVLALADDFELTLPDDEIFFSYIPITAVERLPAADVRPVVLCKDCNYWELSKISPSLHVCTYVCGATFVREAEDFCSRGKKREES